MSKVDKPAKALTAEDAKKIVTDRFVADSKPERVMEKVAKVLNSYQNANNPEEKKKIEDELVVVHDLAASVMSLENHYRLGGTTTPELRPLVMELCRKIIKEYGCKTVLERTLAEVAAGAYIRIIRCSTALNNAYGVGHATPELNQFIAITGNEVDRASRQYLTAINSIISIKQPSVSLTFKAKNTFVAQNQHINAEGQLGKEQNNAGQ